MDDRATRALLALADAMREAAAETKALRLELARAREMKRSTVRKRSMRNASKTAPVVVSDIAAMAARRALAKVGGT